MAAVAAAAFMALVLAGCTASIDPGEARLCRSLAAGLEPGAQPIEIVAQRPASRRTGPENIAMSGVAITYRMLATGQPAAGPHARHRLLACYFAHNRQGEAAARHLLAVAVDGVPFGPARLHFARRHWLETAAGMAADPEPIAGATRAPQLPRALAILAQALLAGAPQTGIYVALALACALVQGLAGRANLALGELAALGSYGAALGVAVAGGSGAGSALALGMLLGGWTAGIFTAAAGRAVFVPLDRRSGQAPLIASAALGLALAEGARLAQGSGSRPSPPLLDAPVALARAGDFIVTVTPMAVIATATLAAVALALLALMRRCRFGRTWRAVADDPEAAAMLGVDARRLGFGTYALAGVLAGVAGSMLTLATGGASHGTGLVIGLKAVMAAILGGSGSLGGAAAAAFGIGLAEALWAIALPIEHRDAALFAGLAVLLILRPGGLRGRPDLEPAR